jgi:hypothetical protein
MNNDIFGIINPDNTMTINRPLAHAIGLEETLVFAALISKQAYYEKNGKMTADGMFFSTIEDLCESTTLSAFKQKKCIDKLVKLGLIFSVRKGAPAKRYFRINDNISALEKLVKQGDEILAEIKTAKQDVAEFENKSCPNCETSYEEITKQDSQKFENKLCENYETSFEEISNKTKENNLNINNLNSINQKSVNPNQTNQNQFNQKSVNPSVKEELSTPAEMLLSRKDLTDRFDDDFVENVFLALNDGLTDDCLKKIYSRVIFWDVCNIAKNMEENHIHRDNLRSYLRSALFKAVMDRETAGVSAKGLAICTN